METPSSSSPNDARPDSLSEKCVCLYRYLWDRETKEVVLAWAKMMLSPKGAWAFIPAIAGIFFVYWAKASGHLSLVNKEYNEKVAIWVMGLICATFLFRAFRYKIEMDWILFIMAVNFLCREVHFAGTSTGVFVVFGIVIIWVLCWKKRLLENVRDASLFQASLTGTAFCYFLAFIIQKRVFRESRCPLLPDEAGMHIFLEEVLENVSHLFFLVTALVAFRSLNKKKGTRLEVGEASSHGKPGETRD